MDDTAPDEPTATPSTDRDRPRSDRGEHRSFPGGATKLPRLTKADRSDDAAPEVVFVPSAFLHDPAAREASTGVELGDIDAFSSYNSLESLFAGHQPGVDADPSDTADADRGPFVAGPVDTAERDLSELDDEAILVDPYAVLGLAPEASWDQVGRAHRELVAQLHPDRFVDADDMVREAAERRVRAVNDAYATIRRERIAARS